MADFPNDPYPDYASANDFYGTFRRSNQGRLQDLANQGKQPTAEQFAYDSAAGTLLNLRSANYNLPIGYANLGQILASQGKTDPRLMNQQLTEISRSGAANQQGMREQLAQMGLGGSGVGLGLQAAQGQATANQRSGLMAQEAQLAEARKRQDIELMINALVNPSLQGYGIVKGVQVGQNALDAQKKAAWLNMLSTLGGAAVAGCWVAREVYGIDNPRWLAFREWMFTKAPEALREQYMAHGPALARFLRSHPVYKRSLRRSMDRILEG